MALRRSLSALSRLVPAACSEAAPLAQSSSQQPLSLWRCLPCQGFAASAAALQSAPAPASAPTSTSATAGAAAAVLRLGGEGPAAAALPEVYARLEEGVAQLYSVQPKRVFAVVEVGGTQYKVTPNDVIVVEKLAGVDVNDKLQLQRVLLLGSQAETIIGRPYVPDAAVTAAVEVRPRRHAGCLLSDLVACLFALLKVVLWDSAARGHMLSVEGSC